MHKMVVATSPKVVRSPLTLLTKVMPSTTETEFPGCWSATGTSFCKVVAKQLCCFFSSPSGVDRDQGNGPRDEFHLEASP